MGKEYWTLSFSLELSDGGSTYKKVYECYQAWSCGFTGVVYDKFEVTSYGGYAYVVSVNLDHEPVCEELKVLKEILFDHLLDYIRDEYCDYLKHTKSKFNTLLDETNSNYILRSCCDEICR